MPEMRNCRPLKGKSLFEFPNDYTVIDIETTGMPGEGAEIIEVSALRFRGDELSAQYSELIKPALPISFFITQLTGITNAMVRSARPRTNILREFRDFLGEDVLIGHNVNFDVNFLYDEFTRYLGEPLPNDFVDVLRLSRHYLPDLPNHKQTTVAEYFCLDTTGAHRALKDTELCAGNYLGIKSIAHAKK